jgi:hypothetical protein
VQSPQMLWVAREPPLKVAPATSGVACDHPRFFFFLNIYINFNLFLLITADGILDFKPKLTLKNGIFHPS